MEMCGIRLGSELMSLRINAHESLAADLRTRHREEQRNSVPSVRIPLSPPASTSNKFSARTDIAVIPLIMQCF